MCRRARNPTLMPTIAATRMAASTAINCLAVPCRMADRSAHLSRRMLRHLFQNIDDVVLQEGIIRLENSDELAHGRLVTFPGQQRLHLAKCQRPVVFALG